MKRFIGFFLAAITVFSLSGCEEEKTMAQKFIFRLGPEGMAKEISAGDTFGDWIFEGAEASGEILTAKFTGEVEVQGMLSHNLLPEGEGGWLFEVSGKDLDKMPVFAKNEDDFIRFSIDPESEIINSVPDIEPGSRHSCRIVISEYCPVSASSIPGTALVNSAEFWVETDFIEPSVIAEHIHALNEVALETFFAEREEDEFCALYKEKSDGPYWDKTPDVLLPSEEASAPEYADYYSDETTESCRKIINFSSEDEIAKHIGNWLASEVFDDESFRRHILEYEGKAYLMRYSRGYGLKTYGNSAITSEGEDEMTATAYIYYAECDEVGKANLCFEKRGGNWILVSVEDNYYRNEK